MSLDLSGATVLVLAPHTDDGELGAGGTIAKLVEQGNDVHYVAFSACETVQPPDVPADRLRHECAGATSTLGIPAANLRILDFEVRFLERDRQQVLDAMIEVGREVAPDLVMLPSTHDTHQDHHTVSLEAHRAFKKTRMLGFEVPWNNFHFDSTAFSVLREEHIARKWEALTHFHSQVGRGYMTEEYVRAQAVFRGTQAGVGLAEAFQVIRWFL